MNLLIVEPEATGHRMALYVRLLVRASMMRGWTISLLTTQEATKHASFKIVQEESAGKLQVFLMEPMCRNKSRNFLVLMARQVFYYFYIKKAFSSLNKRMTPDLIYISCLDYFDKALAMMGSPFRGVPFVGLLTSVKFHRHHTGIGPRSRSDYLYRWLFHRLLTIRTLKRILIIDETFMKFAEGTGFSLYAKVVLIPDVGEVSGQETQRQVRCHIGIPLNAFVLLVYGSLSQRKGIKELLQAVDSPDAPPGLMILLAGDPDPFVKKLLATHDVQKLRDKGVLKERLFFHSPEDEYRVFRAADAVWLGYVGGSYGSSGVLYQAGSIGIPLIATSRGLIGWLTEQHSLGLTIEPTDYSTVIESLNCLYSDAEQNIKFGENGIHYASNHTAKKFGDAVCEQLSLSIKAKKLF